MGVAWHGLESDGVELVVAVEDAFDITISDDEAYKVITPKDAFDLISRKVQENSDPTCLNQVAFHHLRRILANEFGVRRSQVKVDSDLSQLVPPEKQQDFWNRVKTSLLIEGFPDLSRPAWVVYSAWGVSGLISLGLVLTLGLGLKLSLIIGCPLVLVMFWLLMLTTRPMKKLLPSSYKNMERLVRFVVIAKPDAFKKKAGWSPSQIKEEIKNIVMDVIGPCEYNEEWEFVKDFGID